MGGPSPGFTFLGRRGTKPVTTVTIFWYAAKREATWRNGTKEDSVEILGVSDLSFLFAMRFGTEVYNPPLSARSFGINQLSQN